MATPTTCSTGPGANDPGCPTVMTSYCSTDELLGDTYIEKWQGGSSSSECRRFVDFNAGNQAQYVSTVDGLARRYLITDSNPITYPQQGSLIYDPRIETVITTCQDYPGGCDDVLDQVCSGYTRADLANNPNLAKLCGCFMADAQYDNYAGSFGVKKICDPACVLQSAVKPKDVSNQFITLSCDQTVCVIDDVNISILGKSNVGDITFAQACGSCSGGAGCTCNISDISISAVESTVKNINFSQQCGSVNCFKSDANGVPIKVECGTGATTSGGTSATTSPKAFLSNTIILIIIVVLIVLIVLLIILAVIFSRRGSGRIPPVIVGQGYGAAPPPAINTNAGYVPLSNRRPI